MKRVFDRSWVLLTFSVNLKPVRHFFAFPCFPSCLGKSSFLLLLLLLHGLKLNAMKDSSGAYHPCPSMKSWSNKIGGLLNCCSRPNKYDRLDKKLERKMIELKSKKYTPGIQHFKSIDSVILRFPQFREGLGAIREVFEQCDEDSNGAIDCEELKKGLQKLQLHLPEQEIEDLFHSCDFDGSEGIQFDEFIVLLCIIYLLKEPSSSLATWKTDSSQLEATFNTVIEVFLFLDKNGDGKLNKKDIVKALNEAHPWERSPAHVIKTRFKEMDWDKSGQVTFREFLFGFIKWVGIDVDDDEIPIS